MTQGRQLSRFAMSKSKQMKPAGLPSRSKLLEKTLRTVPKTRDRSPRQMEKGKERNQKRIKRKKRRITQINHQETRGGGIITPRATAADTTTITIPIITETPVIGRRGKKKKERVVAHGPSSGAAHASVIAAAAYPGDDRLHHTATAIATAIDQINTTREHPTTRAAERLTIPTTREEAEAGEEEEAQEEVEEDHAPEGEEEVKATSHQRIKRRRRIL